MPSEAKGFRGVSIKKELVDELEAFIVTHPEYKGNADFIHEAIRVRMQQIRESKKKRFEHLNMGENVKIIEHNPDGTIKAVADIYFKQPNEIRCENCKTTACEHIEYMLSVPKIREVIKGLNKRPGWNIELTDEV